MAMKSRQAALPNGWQYRQPETAWVPTRYSSFDSVVDQLIAHRMGNPYLMQTNGWSIDRATVEMEVDRYNERFCRAMGGDWLQWVDGGPPIQVPFQPPPPPPILSQLAGGVAAVKKLASGAAILFEWEESKEPPVAAELSTKRAAICSTCPKNSKDVAMQWVTGPLAEGFRRRVERLHQLNLTTPSDAQLGGCSACLCPLPLKVHAPLHLVLKRLTPEQRADLAPQCWILNNDQ
jgi:hypothetical protein